MPRTDDDGSDSEEEVALGLVMDRSSILSTASMTADDRAELMDKVNKDLQRKVADAEATMQRRMSEQEAELENMQIKLDEWKMELMAARKEEKELKNKEVCFRLTRNWATGCYAYAYCH